MDRPHRSFGSSLAAALLAALVATPSFAVTLAPGDLIVSGSSANGTFLARVHPVTGAQEIITQGGLVVGGRSVCVAADGYIYTGNAQNIVRVNPADGAQVLLTGTIPLLQGPNASGSMIAHTDGMLYYTSTLGEVFRVALPAGTFAPLTSGLGALGIAEGPDGAIYGATCFSASGGACGSGPDPTTDIVVRRINPASGAYATWGHGPIGKPRNVAFDARDSMYVDSSNDRRVFRFDPVTHLSGALTGLDLTYTLGQMVGHPNGSLYATHNYAPGGGKVDRLDPVTGVKSTVSSFGPTVGLLAICVVRDWVTPAQSSTWGKVKHTYR